MPNIDLAPKSKAAYLKLIGYLVERLIEAERKAKVKYPLDIDRPFAATSQIIKATELTGKVPGSKPFIGGVLKEAVEAWHE